MELGILIFCCIRNYFRARAANLNAALWSFYTFLASIVTWFMGGIIITLIMIARDSHLRKMLMQQPPDQQEIVKYLTGKNLFVPQLFLIVCMVGGYLFVRHLITKREKQVDS
ncbi:MAG TPA: hypothetical protein PL009_07895 [Flavipsychrobacter sp.]|nr:hypothetical protein [Flavipsychrobacter sp.]